MTAEIYIAVISMAFWETIIITLVIDAYKDFKKK